MPTKPTPIYSTLEDVPEQREPINEFVVGLAEAVDHLQDAENSGALDQLRTLAEGLARTAEEVGYPPLSDVALAVCKACQDDKPEIAQKALVTLTETARRIRLGHRGAA